MERKKFPRTGRPNWPLPPYAVFRCRPARPWIVPDTLVLESHSFEELPTVKEVSDVVSDHDLSEPEETFQFKPRQRAIRRKSSSVKSRPFVFPNKDNRTEGIMEEEMDNKTSNTHL